MKINKISAGMLMLLGIVGGGAAMIAAQSHAQQAPVPQVQAVSTVQDVQTPGDTDNIQDDQGGIDKPDAPGVKDQTDKNGHEENDQNEANEAPGTELED